MSRPDTIDSKHLRQLEIDRLLAGEKQGLEAALSHLEDCETCRSRFEMQQQEHRSYAEPRARVESERLLFVAAQRAQTKNRTRVISTIGGLAAAAAVALVCAIVFMDREPLPEYAFSVSHGAMILRDGNSDAPEVPRFAPHSRLRIDLRPAEAVKGPLEARVWAERGDSLQHIPLSVKTSADGALRLEGVVGEDFSLSPGRYTLWVFVFRDGNYDDPAAIRAAVERGLLSDGEGVLLKTEVVFFDEDNEDQDSSRALPHN